jgi:FdhE protein
VHDWFRSFPKKKVDWNTDPMTQEVWLGGHPYLQRLADFHAKVAAAVASISVPCADVPIWKDYMEDFRAGMPLLHSAAAAIDVRPAETILTSLVETLTGQLLPFQTAREILTLAAELRGCQTAPGRLVAWLIHEGEFTSTYPGLLRYLGWTALRQFLSPVLDAFAQWRDEEQWLHGYCPTCGSLPAMAQLVGIDFGRMRRLSCGCCSTRWRFGRTGCPFCENKDDRQINAVAIEGEAGLRIDYCSSCGGYLKTCSGERDEFLMQDWTSLHLDVIARERGLKRLAASLYEL